MYCKQCGKQYVTDEAVVCVSCGAQKGTGANFCHNCGSQVNPGSTVCMNCGVAITNIPAGATQKSKVAAGLLGIFLGAFGVHNFYLGYTTKGLIQVLVATIGGLITCGIATTGIGIWGLVEGIMILTGSINKDANGMPLKD